MPHTSSSKYNRDATTLPPREGEVPASVFSARTDESIRIFHFGAFCPSLPHSMVPKTLPIVYARNICTRTRRPRQTPCDGCRPRFSLPLRQGNSPRLPLRKLGILPRPLYLRVLLLPPPVSVYRGNEVCAGVGHRRATVCQTRGSWKSTFNQLGPSLAPLRVDTNKDRRFSLREWYYQRYFCADPASFV